MFQDLFLSMLTMFVLEPVQAQLSSQRAPVAVVEQVGRCGKDALPILVERAANDTWWGVTTVISVAVGLSTPLSVLSAAHPSCPAAVRAAEPYFAAAG